DEAAANVDGGAAEAFDSKSVESNCRSDGIDDRVHRSDLVEFDIFRLNVVNLPFRNRELRKNLRRYPLRVRVQLALMDHRQYLGRLAMKVSVGMPMLVSMFVCMLMGMFVIVMMVVVLVLVMMFRFGKFLMMAVVVFAFAFNNHIEFDCADVRPGH